MTAISERKHGEFCRCSFTGTVRPVLLEHGHGDDKGADERLYGQLYKIEVAAAPRILDNNRI